MSELSKYLENPDELPLNEDEAERLIAEMGDDTPEAEAAKPEAEMGDDEGEKEAEGEKAVEAEAEADREGEPERVIKTRDGKHEIPYSVLESERAKARQYYQELEQARKTLQELQQKPTESDADDGSNGAPADKGVATEDYIAKVAEEYGEDNELVRALKAQRDHIQRLEGLSSEVEAIKAQRQRSEQEELQRQVDEALDRVPALRELESKGGDEWAEAVQLDRALSALPRWQGKPLEDRFREVARILGHEAQPKTATPPVDKGGKAKATDAEPPIPTSLSELPGGIPADQDVLDELERISPTDLASKLESMTPDQQEAYLAKLL